VRLCVPFEALFEKCMHFMHVCDYFCLFNYFVLLIMLVFLEKGFLIMLVFLCLLSLVSPSAKVVEFLNLYSN
jgi:hypothetical protein